MLEVRIVISVAAAFMLGAIPWALIIGLRLYGVDLRKQGSGNLGATNVYRILGTRAGIMTAVLDVAKGAAAVGLAWAIVPPSLNLLAHDWTLIGATLAAMLGHSYSPYIRFAGGKGVAVAAGALLVLTPKVWPLLLLTFVLVIALTRYVSLGSVIAAVSFPVWAYFFYGDNYATVVFAVGAAAIVVWRHRSNLARLARREETKIRLRRGGEFLKKGGS